MRQSTVARLLLFLGVSGLATVDAEAADPVIAVVPFGSPSEQNLLNLRRNAQPAYIAQLAQSGRVSIVDERSLRRGLNRIRVKKGGLLRPNKAKQLGLFLKADYILSGSLTFIGDRYTMTTHLTNVRTMELELNDSIDFRNARKFRLAIRASVEKILSLLTGTQKPTKKHGANNKRSLEKDQAYASLFLDLGHQLRLESNGEPVEHQLFIGHAGSRSEARTLLELWNLESSSPINGGFGQKERMEQLSS